MAHENQHFDNHFSRNSYLKTTNRFRNIWRNYKPLYDNSLKARYLMATNQSAESLIETSLGQTGVQDKIMNHYLRQVEKSVSKIIEVSGIFLD